MISTINHYRSLLVIPVLAAAICVHILARMRPPYVTAFTSSNPKPQIGFPAEVYITREDESPALISVRLSAAPAAGQEVVVRYNTLAGTATAGASGDYLDTTGIITFTHSSPKTQSFPVFANDDVEINEPDETVNLILTLLTPGTATIKRNVAVLIINDDDMATATPTVQFDETVYLQPVLAPDTATPTLTPTPPCAARAQAPLPDRCASGP